MALLQQKGRQEHPHHAIINDLIKDIKAKQKYNNEIIITIDGDEPFISSNGGISHLCCECKLFDPLTYRHGDAVEGLSRIKGSKCIDFIFASFNILQSIHVCKNNAFH